MKSPSRAARLVLLKSTILALPVYTMQTAIIPSTTLNQNFFQGSTLEKPRIEGDLGIPGLKKTNTSFLAKLIWKLVKQPQCLSSEVLTGKYGDNGEFKQNCSALWRSITLWRIQYWFWQGLSWNVGDGSVASFGLGKWVTPEPLITYIHSPLPEDHKCRDGKQQICCHFYHQASQFN